MRVYGSNVLKRALRVQGTSLIEYYPFKENRIDPSGVEIPIYAPAVKVQASVQAVPKEKYQELGLDLKTTCIKVLCCIEGQTVNRGRSNDRIRFNGHVYDVVATTDWFAQDGWMRLIGVLSVNEGALYPDDDRR